MTYAIVQSSLEIPDVEKLKRAFRSVPTLTNVDAHILANDAYGILVKGKTAEHARRLVESLRGEGIETEMVADQLLPELPQSKFVRKLHCTEEALVLHDPLGRPFRLPWEHIMFIAAGNVKLQEFKRTCIDKKSVRFDGAGNPYSITETDYSTTEESRYKFLLEIIITRAALRYSVTVDKSMLFQSLGDEFNIKLEQSFATLIGQMTQFAPNAALNRGAYYLRENAGEVFSYPTKNAFQEEIIWLLWRMKQGQD